VELDSAVCLLKSKVIHFRYDFKTSAYILVLPLVYYHVQCVSTHTEVVASVHKFLDWEAGFQNATPVVLVLVVVLVVHALKIPKALLIHSGAQRNFAYTLVLTFPTDLPSEIFKLMSN